MYCPKVAKNIESMGDTEYSPKSLSLLTFDSNGESQVYLTIEASFGYNEEEKKIDNLDR